MKTMHPRMKTSNSLLLSALLLSTLTAACGFGGPQQHPVDPGTRAATLSTMCDSHPNDLPNQKVSAPGWDALQGVCGKGAYVSKASSGPISVTADADQAAIGSTIIYGCLVYSSDVDLTVLLSPSHSGSNTGAPAAPIPVTFPKSLPGKERQYCTASYVLKGSKGTAEFKVLGAAVSQPASATPAMPVQLGVHRIFEIGAEIPVGFSLASPPGGHQPG